MTDRKRPSSTRSRRAHRNRPAGKGRRGEIRPPNDVAGGSATGPDAPRTASPGGAEWLYGVHAVAAALANSERTCHRLLASRRAMKSHGDQMWTAIAAARGDGAKRPEAEHVENDDLERILAGGAVHQGLALLVEPLPSPALEDLLDSLQGVSTALIVVLDQATDPQNVGAITRSAVAFGAVALMLQDRHAPSAMGGVAKAASGALERLPIVRVTNLARSLWKLKDADFWCLGLDGGAERTLDGIEVPSRLALVLGAEGAGLRRLTKETCDDLARIAINEAAESLNLSNAAAVALYATTRPKKS